MKTLLSTIGILAAMAGTASAAPYVLPTEQTGALNMIDLQPVYSAEFNYAISGEDGLADVCGPRLAFSLYSAGEGDFLHQFSLNVAALWGSDTVHVDGLSLDNDVTQMPLTFGYDLNIHLFDKVYLDLGAKVGATISDMEWSTPVEKLKMDETAFTFAVGAGIKVKFSDTVYGKIGYEFGRTYYDIAPMTQHTLSIGVGCQF